MAKIRTLQLYRGTTAQNDAYTGSAGELTMDTTTNELRLHDGSTVGGHIIGSGGGSGSGYHPDLFDVKWADHICNDAQWLRADTFSWQSGAVYQAAYQHLVDDITGKTLQSETVAGITVQFYLADDGHKICPASEEDKVLSIYNKTGNAWYYIIDTTNQRFKLPRRHSQQIVRSVKNADGSWYRLYADGWVEQGGYISTAFPETTTVTLVVAMADTHYNVNAIAYYGTGNQDGVNVYIYNVTTSSIGISNKMYGGNKTINCYWQVSGQSAIDMSSFQDGEKYLYFYVGAFTQTAIENTAGLNTELFNQKADLNLTNVSAAGKATAVGWGMPDYTSGVAFSNNTDYTAPTDGFVIASGWTNTSTSSYFDLNGTRMATFVYNSSAWLPALVYCPVHKGDVIRINFTQVTSTMNFYPLKGV